MKMKDGIMTLNKAASDIASHGRFGDDSLLHVSKAELRGLASLAPGGELPINPKTGLPEAFFFLPFLMGAGAAAAPAAAAAAAPALAGAAGAAGLGALGTGITAGMTAATGAMGGAGLGSLAAAAPAITAASAPAITAASAPAITAAAMPAATTAATTAANAAAPVLASAAPAATTTAMTPLTAAPAASALPAEGAINALVGQAHGLGAIPAQGPLGMLPAEVSGIPASSASAALGPSPTSVMGQGVFGPASPVTNPFSTMPQAGDLAAGLGPEPLAGAAPPVETVTPMGYDTIPAATTPSAPASPATPFTGSTEMAGGFGTPESLYPATPTAEKGGLGGLLGGMDMNTMLPLAMLAQSMPMGGGGGDDEEGPDTSKVKYEGGDPVFPDDDYEAGIDDEWNYFPNTSFYKRGGVVGYANGGIAQLDAAASPPGQMAAPQQMPQMAAPAAGIASLQNPLMEQAMTAPMPAAASEGGVSGKESDDQIVEEAVMALSGQHPAPDAALMKFVKTFGEAALQDLAMRVQSASGGMGGPGDGMSDSIPGTIDGQQPVRLSEGEYIVPADVVSGLGNGSTQAGGKQLDAMVGRTRMMRNGGLAQPPAMQPRSVMPV